MAEISVWHQALVGVGPGFCIRVRSLCFVYVSNGVAALFVYLGSTDRVCAIDSSVLGVWTMRVPRSKTPIHATEHTLKLSKPVLALVGSWNQMTNHLSASSVKTQPRDVQACHIKLPLKKSNQRENSSSKAAQSSLFILISELPRNFYSAYIMRCVYHGIDEPVC